MKILKKFAIGFLILGIITYTACAFMEPELLPVFIIIDAIFGFFLYKLLRKKKPKKEKTQKSSSELTITSAEPEEFVSDFSFSSEPPLNINVEIKIDTDQDLEQIYQSMHGAYTEVEVRNDFRILQDCYNIFENTKNLETFFSRYECGMRIVSTWDCAAKVGVVPDVTNYSNAYLRKVNSQKERVLTDSFWFQKEEIGKLVTPKAKLRHWKQYLEILRRYEDRYEYNQNSQYPIILERVRNEVLKIEITNPNVSESEKQELKDLLSPGSSDQFSLDNFDYIEKMTNQASAPQMKDYDDLEAYKKAYELCLDSLHTLKEFCYQSAAGKRWFQEYYCHCFNSRCKDFSLEDQIEEGYQNLISDWENYERLRIITKNTEKFIAENSSRIQSQLIDIIRSEPGILQKDIYSRFDPIYKPVIISVIGTMNKKHIIFREKYKNTFKLYLSPSDSNS